MTSSPGSEASPPVGIGEVRSAAARLSGHVMRTPLLESATVNALTGGRLLIKAEALQHTGSFKYRGALNRISRLSAEERASGVVAYSSGNHGQAVAAVAREFGIEASIVMPADAPEIKTAGVRRLGARIVPYERSTEAREQVAAQIAAETGATLVPPFDDPWVIAGQGTVGLEIADQLEAAGLAPNVVLVPCSGGGLIAGCAIALTHRWPDVRVYAVEPEGFDDTARSLVSGERERISADGDTLCDALRVAMPGRITFDINRALLAGGLTVTDGETLAAMAAAFAHFKLVLEPGGAVGLAAALTARTDCRDKLVVVVGSGGNVDRATFAKALQSGDTP